MTGMWEAIGNAIKEAFSFVGDAIVTALSNFVGKFLYIIVKLLCYLVKLTFNFFNIFSGQGMVEYDGAEEYLINVFFGNKSINNIYWGMALIGFAFIIVFTIISVIKKSFDLDEKVQRSHGQILRASAKSALTILLLSAIMSATLNMTNLLITEVSNIFSRAGTLDQENEMYFTDEQYATMARVLNTIGNYSLNDSYNSRYNLNSCYNSIRQDLLKLQEEGVFSFYYDEKDGKSWQSMLAKLVKVRDPRYDIALDDKNTVNALVDIMDEIRTNDSFYPLSYIKRGSVVTNDNVSLDVVVFLSGTLDSARNTIYNEDPSISDACRAPFMNKQLDIYSFDDVTESFDTSVTGISYILIGIVAVFTFKNLAICLFNCIGRIFNLLGLYIIAPPIVAVSPLDDGAKFKQWINATVVQVFGIFGNIIPMRMLIMFVPLIMDSKLVLFPNSGVLNFLGKVLLLIGGLEACQSFTGIITGILTDGAAQASAAAGDKSKLAGGVGGALATMTGMKAIGRMGQKFKDKAEDKLISAPFENQNSQNSQNGQGGGQGGDPGPSKRDMVKGAANGAISGGMNGGAGGAAAGAAMGAAGAMNGQSGGPGGGLGGSLMNQMRSGGSGDNSGGGAQGGGAGGNPGGGSGYGGGAGGNPGNGAQGGGMQGLNIQIKVLPKQMKR